MGVVGQVIQNLLRSPKGAFGVNDPFLRVEFGEPALASLRIGQGGIGQAQGLLAFQHLLEPVQELASEEGAQCFDGKEELALLGPAPALTVAAQGAAGHDAMEMRMKVKLLPPGVKDSADTQVPMKAVAPELEQALGSGIEQERVEAGGVGQDQRVEILGQRHHTMIVSGGQ